MGQQNTPLARPAITVFTPTYNRGHLLQRLYDSLLIQTFKNFEWVIVDDGSVDATRELVGNFTENAQFQITYVFQKNAGKHIAVNNGVSLARGELFFIVDSDDWLPGDSLETIQRHWNDVQQLPDASSFAGVSGNRIHSDGKINGGPVDYDTLDADIYEYRQRRKYKGDKAEAYATEVLKKYPFPQFENETFCPESLIWNRIGNTYQIRYFNKAVYIGDYLEGGLTDRTIVTRSRSPRYTSLVYSELANNPRVPFARRIKASINYWRFAPYNHYQSIGYKLNAAKWFWSAFCLPVGYLLYLYDKKRILNKI